MNEGKEPRGFAGLASLASELEGEAARPQAEETEAEDGPRASATETTQAEADDATRGDRAHDKDDSTGFSALPAMASDEAAETRPTTQRGRAIGTDEARTHSPGAKSSNAAGPKATNPARERLGEPGKPPRSEPPRPAQAASSGWKWIWLVMVGVMAVIIFGAIQKTQKPSRGVTSTPQIASEAVSQAPTTRGPERLSDLTFSKPKVGSDNVLNAAEIRWCLREAIQMDTLQAQATTNPQIEEFNNLVSDYNARCASYRYRIGTLARARREVEQYRSEIVASVSPPGGRRRPPANGGAVARSSQHASDVPSETGLTTKKVLDALRQSDPKYKDYSDDELARWLNQAYGPEWLKVLTERHEATRRGQGAEVQETRVAEAPATEPTRHTADDSARALSPRTTEQAPDSTAQAVPSPRKDQEAPQGVSTPEGDPLAQASLDPDLAEDRPVGATEVARDVGAERRTGEEHERGADQPNQTEPSAMPLETGPEPSDRRQNVEISAPGRRSEQAQQTRASETTRPMQSGAGGGAAEPKTTAIDQAPEQLPSTEDAHRERSPETTGRADASNTEGSEADPPSSQRQQVREIQMYLTALGYEPGPIDGLYGPKTMSAIEAFERDIGVTPTGEATIDLWKKARWKVETRTQPRAREEVDGTRGTPSEADGTRDATAEPAQSRASSPPRR